MMRLLLSLTTLALALAPTLLGAQTVCPDRPACREVSNFAVTLTDFRASERAAHRYLNLTLRFTNKTNRPLVLGYVSGSAAGYDDRGNKYAVANNSTAVRGIGIVERQRFDPKFTLAAGESADARIELSWYAANVIAGVEFDLEIGIREIDPLPGNQYRLGREYQFTWQHLKSGAAGGAGAAARASPAGPSAASPAAVPAPQAAGAASASDPCAGDPQCSASGPLVGRIVGVQTAQKANYHHVIVRISFQNLGAGPMILNYKDGTGEIIDERGQKYGMQGANAVQGIPVSTRQRASSSFQLAPGESRTASFDFRRFVGNDRAGTAFNPSLAIEQYELMPSNQLRLEREYSLSFGTVRGGGLAGGLAGGSAPGSAEDVGNAIRALGDLLKKR